MHFFQLPFVTVTDGYPVEVIIYLFLLLSQELIFRLNVTLYVGPQIGTVFTLFPFFGLIGVPSMGTNGGKIFIKN